MRKSEITLHAEHFRAARPAINVKQRGAFGPSIGAITDKFGCTDSDAQHALELAWDSAARSFWEQIGETVAEIFPGCKAYSEGRSEGWLVVEGLPDVESWNGAMVAKWGKLVRIVREDIKYRSAPDTVLEDIETNEWFKPGAELYNFIDSAEGETRCIADLKASAVAAGFGPVVRR